jgi:hypothetical protein
MINQRMSIFQLYSTAKKIWHGVVFLNWGITPDLFIEEMHMTYAKATNTDKKALDQLYKSKLPKEGDEAQITSTRINQGLMSRLPPTLTPG